MKAIKVNGDYESVLFQNKQLPRVNEALEPLALYLSDSPIISSKKYSEDFLSYVEEKKGKNPSLKKEGSFDYWWGPLKDIELEKRLNSKEMSAELTIQEGWCSDTHIISRINELPNLEGKVYLAKNPYGMSGQNFCRVETVRLESFEQMLRTGKVILEPLFKRVYDFSHYIYPNGVRIAYENSVDEKFQYKGTTFINYTQPTIKNLPFYPLIDQSEWTKFEERLETIIRHYTHPELMTGFSIDSFIYEENGQLKIRALSEVNYRRTMGQTSFEFALRYGGLRKWNQLVLRKSSSLSFPELRETFADREWKDNTSRGVLIISPGDVRYDMFLLSANDAVEGELLLKEFHQCTSSG